MPPFNRAQRRRLTKKHGYTAAQLDLVDRFNAAREKAPSGLTPTEKDVWADSFQRDLRLGVDEATARASADQAVSWMLPETRAQ